MSKICWLAALDVGDGATAPIKSGITCYMIDRGMSSAPEAVTLHGAAGAELFGYVDHNLSELGLVGWGGNSSRLYILLTLSEGPDVRCDPFFYVTTNTPEPVNLPISTNWAR